MPSARSISARWRRAIVRCWWLPVAGSFSAASLGGLYSLRGGSDYKAAALISLGQPVSPGGAIVNGFYSNPRAIALITSSASAQSAAEQAAGLPGGALRGQVSVAQVGSTTGAGATRVTPLVSLSVRGASPAKTADAANALVGTGRQAHHGAVRRHEDRDLPHRAADDEDAAALDQRADRVRRQGDRRRPPECARQARPDHAAGHGAAAPGNLLNQLSSTQTAARVLAERRERAGSDDGEGGASPRRTPTAARS